MEYASVRPLYSAIRSSWVAPEVTAWTKRARGAVVPVLGFFSFLFFLALPGQLSAQDGAQLRVCFLGNNLPFSSQQGEHGFDVDVAQAIARTMGRRLVPVWVKNDERITEVDESDFPLRRLSKNDCDAILSVPGRDAVREASNVTVGNAYYGAAFELLGREGQTPASLHDIEHQVVAVQAQTIASFILESLKISMQTFFSTEESLAAVTTGGAQLAFVWGPTAGWYAKQNPEANLTFATAEPISVARWNEHAATRTEDKALRTAIDAALTRLRKSGELKTIAGRYGVPLYPPFEKTYDVMEMFRLSREAAKK